MNAIVIDSESIYLVPVNEYATEDNVLKVYSICDRVIIVSNCIKLSKKAYDDFRAGS